MSSSRPCWRNWSWAMAPAAGPARQPQLSPKAEQLARIDERQKYQDALDAGFDLSKARLSLLRALGHMEDWLDELHAKVDRELAKTNI